MQQVPYTIDLEEPEFVLAKPFRSCLQMFSTQLDYIFKTAVANATKANNSNPNGISTSGKPYKINHTTRHNLRQVIQIDTSNSDNDYTDSDNRYSTNEVDKDSDDIEG